MTDQPAAEMERDPEADDQMVALALAKLAIERPGWLWTLRGLAKARGFLDHFEGFQEIHADAAGTAAAAERDRLLVVNKKLVTALKILRPMCGAPDNYTIADVWKAQKLADDVLAEAHKP